ncbi:hypothetical protein KQI84_14530 [bacterium]|nr:hypothetical protein [bacterium]
MKHILCAILGSVLLCLLVSPSYADVGDAVDNTDLVWGDSVASISPWFSQTAYTHDGVDAARSGAVGNVQQSDLTTVVQGPGTLSFWWKVSSQNDSGAGRYDILYFWYDNSVGMTMIFGDVDWEQKVIEIPEGTHTLNWSYAKDIGGSAGLDAAFLDQVTWSTGGSDTTPPENVSGFNAQPGDGQVTLLWTNPVDDFAGTRIQRRTDDFPADENDGDNIYDGTGTQYVDSGLVNGTTFYYTAFSYDGVPNYAGGVQASASPRVPPTPVPGDVVTSIWSKVFDGGGGDDHGRSLAIDSQGNLIVGGQLKQEFSASGIDAYAAKYDPTGENVLWSNTYTTGVNSDQELYRGVCVDSHDNMILVGQKAASEAALLIRKFSADGQTLLWEHDYAVGAWNYGRGVAVDGSDNIYVCGYEFGGWDDRRGQWVILKYDPDGNLATGFPMHYNYSTEFDYKDIALDIAVDTAGNMTVVGYRGNVPAENLDWHVRKYSAAGTLMWESTYAPNPNTGDDIAWAVVLDEAGDAYVSGYTHNGNDLDILVMKYASGDGKSPGREASPLWTKTIAHPAAKTDQSLTLALVSEETLLVGGYITDENDVAQSALYRFDTVEGILLGEQVMDLTVPNLIRWLDYRDGILGTAGSFGNGTDYDILISTSTLREPPVSGWMMK